MDKIKFKGTRVCKALILLFLTGIEGFAFAQTTERLSIDECYSLAQKNFPLIKQMALIQKARQYNIKNAAKGLLPQFTINGQGSYQSEVTEIKIPTVATTSLSKDQYKIFGEVDQSLTDGAIVKQKKELARANAETNSQQIEVELYNLKERINQIYFGILLLDAQIAQTELLKNDIQAGIDNTNAAIANGTALRSNADNLRAELLKTEQQTIELKAERKGYAGMLGIFIGKNIDEAPQLAMPVTTALQPIVNRPELKLYDVQKKGFDIQRKLITCNTLPKLGFFFQAGYGRPTLNFLKNEFTSYYIGGLKLNWNFGGLYSAKNDKALLKISQQTLDVQKEVFLFNTSLSLSQQSSEVTKYRQLINTDSEIILLREKIKNTGKYQLRYGAITTNDYLTYVNAENQAKQNLVLHQVQLNFAQFNSKTTSGN